MRNTETKVISTFPACGKTYYFENNKDKKVLDSDSSEFGWVKDKDGKNTKVRNPEFPSNYINYIKSNIGKVDVILVSSHKEVRIALEENKINYTLVYPRITAREEWEERFKKRGNSVAFIDFICGNWNGFIVNMIQEKFPKHRVLAEDEYLSDILTDK